MTLLEPVPVPDLNDLGRVHFIAIGGAGMSGVASGFLARGLAVSGCDQSDSEVLNVLAGEGAMTFTGHDPSHLDGIDTVVVSTAVHDDNPELAAASRLGLRVIHRSVALAALMDQYDNVIAVAGTHGKTTTSAMCVSALAAAGRDPSYVIGGTLLDTHTGAHIGAGQDFVVEADESDGSFRQYPATVALITNVDKDHLDEWGTEEAYAAGFEQFAQGPHVGHVVLWADDPRSARLANRLAGTVPVTMFGTGEGADVRLSGIRTGDTWATAVINHGDWSGKLELSIPGEHNLRNAAGAWAAGVAAGANRDALLAGLGSFTGTARRFEVLGEAAGVTVIDDYAHHPGELETTLASARARPDRIVMCFQPHLFTRTRDFADGFAEVLARADEAVVLDVYPAREPPIPGVNGSLVAQAARAHGGKVTYLPDMDDALDVLLGLALPGTTIITVGAGSVTQLGPKLLERLRHGEG